MTAVARAVEYCGFGPTVGVPPRGLAVKLKDRYIPLVMTGDGALDGYESRFTYQNPLPPLVNAVMNVIERVFVEQGGYAPLEGVLTEDFGNKHFLVRSVYLWLVDEEHRERLVLNEFLINGKRMWHSLTTTPYDDPVYHQFYFAAKDLIEDFKGHGRFPKGVAGRDLDVLIAGCFA